MENDHLHSHSIATSNLKRKIVVNVGNVIYMKNWLKITERKEVILNNFPCR